MTWICICNLVHSGVGVDGLSEQHSVVARYIYERGVYDWNVKGGTKIQIDTIYTKLHFLASIEYHPPSSRELSQKNTI